MDSVKQLIHENSIYFKDLEYYCIIIKESEDHLNKNPDISIESCKSLIEGIAKLILSELGEKGHKELSEKNFKTLATEAFR